MGRLYAYRDKTPQVAESAVLFDSAEITGDVVVGEGSIIGAGVKIIGDSHGPVRIGARVQILENTVLHLLPDNELVVEDDVVIGPGRDDPRLPPRGWNRRRAGRDRVRLQPGRRRVGRPRGRVCEAARPLRRPGRDRRFPRDAGRHARGRSRAARLGVRPRRPALDRPVGPVRAATPGTEAHPHARLLYPPRSPRAYALYAARLPAGMAASRLPEAMAAQGFAVLTLDLGASQTSRGAAVEESDVAAVRRAAEQLRAQHPGPALLIGHSSAGPPTLAAAGALGDVRALVTVGSPAPQRPRLRESPCSSCTLRSTPWSRSTTP